MAGPSSEASMPWPLLAQFAAIGADPYTVEVGRLLGNDFKLSVRGERNVTHTLNNLAVYGGDDDNLSFGFGMNHIIRNHDLNMTPFVLTALCEVLTEYFDEEFTARVLGELVKLQQPPCPAPMTPPLRQWRAMVHGVE